MNESIVFSIGCFALIYAVVLIFGVTMHDMRQILSRAQQKQHPRARRYQQRPYVTALMYFDHDLADLELALSNLRADRYRKLDIIIVVPPQLFKAVQSRISHITSRQAVHIHDSRHTQFSTAVRQAYRHFGKGDLIAVFDEQHLPSAHFTLRAVHYFNRHSDVSVVYANILTTSSYRVLGLLQKYGNFTHALYQKALSGLGLSTELSGIDERGGVVYRQSTFLSVTTSDPLGNDAPRYASELTVLAPAAPSLIALLSGQSIQLRESLRTLWQYRAHRPLVQHMISIGILLAKGATMLIPFAAYYCLFMAVQLHQSLFLAIIILLFLGILLFAIVENEALRPVEKVLYVGLSPVTLIPALLLSLLQPWNIIWHLGRLWPVAKLLRKQA